MGKDAATASRTAGLDVALQHAARLAETRPALAVEQADAILEAVPGHPHALLIRGRAERLGGNPDAACQTLRALAADQPRASAVFAELGLAELDAGDPLAAEAAFRRAVTLKPELADAWRGLAAALRALDREEEAVRAELTAIRAAAHDPELRAAAIALLEERLADAEALLRQRLKRNTEDPPALRMLAEVAGRLGRLRDAVALLEDCLDRSPNFDAARELLARILHKMSRSVEALAQADHLIARNPNNPSHRMLRAAVLVRLGDFDEAIAAYRAVLETHPRQPRGWMSLGHALKTVGARADAIAAYRRAIAQAPSLGEAWWSLANLKTFRFEPADMAAMADALASGGANEDDRLHLHFALAKALEDAGDDAQAWEHYAQGNAQRAAELAHDPEETTRAVDRAIATFTPTLLAVRAGEGCAAPDPIFIVGLPRAGSTLIEQVLASHSMVEGTTELPDLPILAARIGGQQDRYPEVLADLPAADLRALGEEYLSRARPQRKTDKPFFIDKLPNNWAHIGLIRLILPNARIIDARRHPLGGCVAAFRQNFARGQAFSYDLVHLGCYYRDYVRLMAHFDRVAPGAVCRVLYEDMVADTEAQVRRLLAHLGLPFELACLAFWETERAVRTPSSEQVRMPVFTDGIDHWKRHAARIGPLEAALGSVLSAWPEVPAEYLEEPARAPQLEGLPT